MTKRLVFSILMILALTAGAAYAQSTINTTAPGPTQQLEPGQTNNNLPNPGNPVNVGPNAQQPLQEQGTVEGTATESVTGQQGANTTGNLDTTGTTTTTGTTAAEVDTTDTGNLNDTDALPSTASKLPLVGLIGLLALAAAFVVRRF